MKIKRKILYSLDCIKDRRLLTVTADAADTGDSKL